MTSIFLAIQLKIASLDLHDMHFSLVQIWGGGGGGGAIAVYFQSISPLQEIEYEQLVRIEIQPKLLC